MQGGGPPALIMAGYDAGPPAKSWWAINTLSLPALSVSFTPGVKQTLSVSEPDTWGVKQIVSVSEPDTWSGANTLCQ